MYLTILISYFGRFYIVILLKIEFIFYNINIINMIKSIENKIHITILMQALSISIDLDMNYIIIWSLCLCLWLNIVYDIYLRFGNSFISNSDEKNVYDAKYVLEKVEEASESDNEVDKTSESDNEVDKTSESDNEVDKTSESDNEVDKTSESDNEVDKTSESDTKANEASEPSNATVVSTNEAVEPNNEKTDKTLVNEANSK